MDQLLAGPQPSSLQALPGAIADIYASHSAIGLPPDCLPPLRCGRPQEMVRLLGAAMSLVLTQLVWLVMGRIPCL